MAPQRSTDELLKQAQDLYHDGRKADAARVQVKAVNRLAAENRNNVDAIVMLGFFLLGDGNFAAAAETFLSLKDRGLKELRVWENLGVSLVLAGKPQQAVDAFLEAVAMAPEKANLHDGLAHAYGDLGDSQSARRHGETALRLKDRQAHQAARVHPLPKDPPPPFDYSHPEKNIISFSVWGDKPRYLEGAIRNATLAPDIYPGWQCRFYCDDSVPGESRQSLSQLGAQVVQMPRHRNFYEGLFWRFGVCNDTTVERFLIRDCDSVINVKERVAVDEWLQSGCRFHVMRDSHAHTELILAGLWGGVVDGVPSIQELLDQYQFKPPAPRSIDQLFLQDMMWPTIKQDCLIHDSLFTLFDARPYPSVGRLPPNRHVGEIEFAIKKRMQHGVVVE